MALSEHINFKKEFIFRDLVSRAFPIPTFYIPLRSQTSSRMIFKTVMEGEAEGQTLPPEQDELSRKKKRATDFDS